MNIIKEVYYYFIVCMSIKSKSVYQDIESHSFYVSWCIVYSRCSHHSNFLY